MEDIKEIKGDVKELLQRSAIHNELLRQHESRSLALQSSQERLESRVKPIEQHVSVMNAALKILGLILVGVVVQFLIRKLLG